MTDATTIRRGLCGNCDEYAPLCPVCGHCVEKCCNCQMKVESRESRVESRKSEITNQKSEAPPDAPVSDEPPVCSHILVWEKNQEPPTAVGVTLIEHILSDRRWLERCDGNCHLAIPEVLCQCICDGAFHGKAWEGYESEKWKRAILEAGPGMIAKWKPLGLDVSGLEKELGKLRVES